MLCALKVTALAFAGAAVPTVLPYAALCILLP